MIKRILHSTDMNDGFMKPGGGLYTEGAESIIPTTNSFIDAIKTGMFDLAIATMDVHLNSTYPFNTESEKFPPHQMWGTSDLNCSVNTMKLAEKMKLLWLLKNDNCMWKNIEEVISKPFEEIEFANVEEARIFNGLYHMATFDGNTYNFLMHRNEFFKSINPEKTEVASIGVLTDWCVKDAIVGYLVRGFKVTMLTDLVYGLYNPNFEGGVANWEELLEVNPIMKEAIQTGQLTRMVSTEYLASLS